MSFALSFALLVSLPSSARMDRRPTLAVGSPPTFSQPRRPSHPRHGHPGADRTASAAQHRARESAHDLRDEFRHFRRALRRGREREPAAAHAVPVHGERLLHRVDSGDQSDLRLHRAARRRRAVGPDVDAGGSPRVLFHPRGAPRGVDRDRDALRDGPLARGRARDPHAVLRGRDLRGGPPAARGDGAAGATQLRRRAQPGRGPARLDRRALRGHAVGDAVSRGPRRPALRPAALLPDGRRAGGVRHAGGVPVLQGEAARSATAACPPDARGSTSATSWISRCC